MPRISSVGEPYGREPIFGQDPVQFLWFYAGTEFHPGSRAQVDPYFGGLRVQEDLYGDREDACVGKRRSVFLEKSCRPMGAGQSGLD